MGKAYQRSGRSGRNTPKSKRVVPSRKAVAKERAGFTSTSVTGSDTSRRLKEKGEVYVKTGTQGVKYNHHIKA